MKTPLNCSQHLTKLHSCSTFHAFQLFMRSRLRRGCSSQPCLASQKKHTHNPKPLSRWRNSRFPQQLSMRRLWNGLAELSVCWSAADRHPAPTPIQCRSSGKFSSRLLVVSTCWLLPGEDAIKRRGWNSRRLSLACYGVQAVVFPSHPRLIFTDCSCLSLTPIKFGFICDGRLKII